MQFRSFLRRSVNFNIILSCVVLSALFFFIFIFIGNVYAQDKYPANVAGSWRPYVEFIYYDSGGNKSIKPVTRYLNLNSNGQWSFGSSNGKWHVENISKNDWSKWGISPNGQTRKIVLTGWNKSSASGPIEESDGRIDFLWVVYRSKSSFGPATIRIKFGH